MAEISGLLEILRASTPGKDIPMTTLRKTFSKFYLDHQRDRQPDTRSETIRPDLPAVWVKGSGSDGNRVILFFHGGGFTIGSTADHIGLCSRLADAAGIQLLGIDYRLAPEFYFPAQVEDAVDAYLFLLRKGFAASAVIPVGISAGGTLVLSLLIACRDRKIPLPACAVCMSPAVNLLFEGRSVKDNVSTDWITQERLDSIRKNYLHGADPHLPLASPLFAVLRGLPPVMIQAGSGELLLDDIIRFVEKSRFEGVEIEFELWEGMFHCWQVFAGELMEGEDAIRSIGNYIRKMTS